MRDDEILQGVEDEMVAVITNAAIPEVASVLPCSSPEDLVFTVAEGQLPAIGVADASGDMAPPFAVGGKAQRTNTEWEISIGVRDESNDTGEARRRARQILGYVLMALRKHKPAASNVQGKYVPRGWTWPSHPQPGLYLLVAKVELAVILGTE